MARTFPSTEAWHFGTVLVVMMVFSSCAIACEPEMYTGSDVLEDKRITVAEDCSFEDQFVERAPDNSYFSVDRRSGGPIRDLGNGRVAQKIVASQLCAPFEYLLFVECDTNEAFMVIGKPHPDDPSEGMGGTFTQFLQAPYGPIRLNSQSSVDELRKIAQANDLEIVEDVKTFLAGNRKRDRYDFACGCKLHYPSSKAATN